MSVRNGSSFQPSASTAAMDGFYQGSGVLVTANRACSPHDAAHLAMTGNRVSFEGISTGVVDGATLSGGQVRLLNARHGSVRLVGTFAGGTFVGSVSDAGCVYDYALAKVAKLEQFAARAAPAAPWQETAALGSPAMAGSYGARTPEAAAPPAPTASPDVSEAQPAAAAQRQARRGEQLLSEGKVAAARRLFERAALAGNPRGALGLGMTYDPSFLASIGSHEAMADALVAKVWYLRAQMFGDKDARSRLAALEARRPS